MLIVRTPYIYVNEPDAIDIAGEHVKGIGNKPLIIGGKRAIESVQDRLLAGFNKYGINTYNLQIFTGFPSENQFNKYTDIAKEMGADVIIGVGGGKALDTAKAVGDNLDLPVVAIPTIAATCAAWQALTVQYDDDGAFVKMRPLKRSPYIVIADTKLLLTTPRRYLFSGVVDTFAKLYENRPMLEKNPDSFSADVGVYVAKIAFDNLDNEVFVALEEAEKGIYGKAAKDVVDAIIYQAGFAGSFDEGVAHYSFAHPFYHVSTRLSNTRHKLHGEKVAYGIVAQLFLEKKPEDYIVETIRRFAKYDAAFTLEDIGISENLDADLDFLKVDVGKAFGYVPGTPDEIKQALLDADKLTKRVLADERR